MWRSAVAAWWGMWGNDGPGWHMGMGMWGNGPRRPGPGLDAGAHRRAARLPENRAQDHRGRRHAAWNQLADAIRTAAKHHNERMKGIFAGDQRSKTLPERVEAQEQFMSMRVEEIKLIKTA